MFVYYSFDSGSDVKLGLFLYPRYLFYCIILVVIWLYSDFMIECSDRTFKFSRILSYCVSWAHFILQ